MSVPKPSSTPVDQGVSIIRTLPRFTLAQRWEHLILLVSVGGLLITGLPQKYRATTWSQQILSTPERVFAIRTGPLGGCTRPRSDRWLPGPGGAR